MDKQVDDPTKVSNSRRAFIQKALYTSPVLLTLPAAPSFAQQGSAGMTGGGPGNMEECPPGQTNICEVTNEDGVSICDLPIEEGGIITDGNLICAS